MANRTRIRELASLLNIQTIANPKFDWKTLPTNHLDCLQFVFESEQSNRKKNSVARNKKYSNLPHLQFDAQRLNTGLQYQVEVLLTCGWVENCTNLLITGPCGVGKTALASFLANNAIEQGFKAQYIKMDELLLVLQNKETSDRARAKLSKIRYADILVFDEFLYLDINKHDLEILYKLLMSLNDTTSIVFISNRDVSDWVQGSDDKYAMQLLINRAIAKAETIRLHENN